MNRTMAERSSRDSESESRPLPSGEQGGLSARMRELILVFNVEERRKRRQGDNGVSASGKRRRRSDTNS